MYRDVPIIAARRFFTSVFNEIGGDYRVVLINIPYADEILTRVEIKKLF